MPKLWLVMEMCGAGSITDLAEMQKPKPLSETVSHTTFLPPFSPHKRRGLYYVAVQARMHVLARLTLLKYASMPPAL